MNKLDAALILVGHGSTENPDSSAPTFEHADEIRRRGIFGEVVSAFWKEEPSLREVYRMLDSREIYVVPNFISEGYFTREVIPRELRLDGATTLVDGRRVHYCDPVGIHASMTRLILHRAQEVAPGVAPGQTSLLVVGHGTKLNAQSAAAIKAQVGLIAAGGYGYAEVLDAYMEEAPFIAKWDEFAAGENVVVVPFFISDGLHSYQDIPVMLGIESELTAAASEREVFRENPRFLRGKTLYYSRAVGTDELMPEVILDQVRAFDVQHLDGAGNAAPSRGRAVADQRDLPAAPCEPGLTDKLERWLAGGGRRLGELVIGFEGGRYRLTHVDDEGREDLEAFSSPAGARRILLYDDAGEYRPLKSAPSLRHGWVLWLDGVAALHEALDYFYPAGLGTWFANRESPLRTVPLREVLERQTGMYRFAKNLSEPGVQALVATACRAKDGCLKRVCWQVSPGLSVTSLPQEELIAEPSEAGEMPLLCVEACNWLVAKARKASADEFESLKLK